MSFYVVRNVYADTPELAEVRPAHREYLQTLTGEGGLRAAGPLDVTPPGGLLVFEADDEGAVREALAKDPLAVEGLIAQQTIEAWKPLVGDTF